ncbi:MAG TPA: cytochrome P450 [Pirellulales bacterium]|jgi:cytochrome P450|nr:cytochrome P450 [Pirellulales bacterium]
MTHFFSDDMRRNPYPVYDQLRSASPVFHVPPPFDAWLIFDYEGVWRALNDHDVFSSKVPSPPNWFIFLDPPRHTQQRGLIARAFTPRVVANLEPYIRRLSRELLDAATNSGEMDLVADYAAPLPMTVIAELIGMSGVDLPRFKRWSDGILKISYTRSGTEAAAAALQEFTAVTTEMNDYLTELIARRRATPEDDLITRLVEAEVDGERLSQPEILGFFQLLVVGGQETTVNLIANAMLCFLESPDQLARLRAAPDLLPAAIEEVLRYRAPLQWVMRTPRRDAEMHGQVIPAGQLVLPMLGSANRDPKQFRDPNRFDIARDPKANVAFGHGIHACLGAPLARLEARIALTDLLDRLGDFRLESAEPWPPRQVLNVHGPASLPIRFEPVRAN